MDTFIDFNISEQYVAKKCKLLIVIKHEIILRGNNEVNDYVKNIMEPYCDDLDCEPKPVKNHEQIFNEYVEHLDMYENFDEFCMKNYCAYFNDDGQLVSALDDNAFWESYEIVENKQIKEIDDFINEEINIIFDETKKMFNKNKLTMDDIINMVSRNLDNNIVILEYI